MKAEKILKPTRKQLLILRVIILIGIGSMGFFLNSLLSRSVAGYLPLYILLIITFVFTCFKILYEWYHYWHITVPPTPAHEKEYTVDIFTTFCAGEPYEMIIETLTAIQNITYPHTTYLCDEADDPYLKEFCKKNNINHVTRINKINAKAGNINNALQQSTGELCVVLDPDHIPFPEFLDPIVSHFNNQKIGFVQIVQAYYNANQGLIAKGAAQQTYQFYGPMMMTMNKYGTVLAIGANCTFRRTALESIGGHAAGLAEDMHTAMQLHAEGWQSVYIPAVLARGLVPATISAYYKQQLKWSRGVFELLVTSYVKLFTKFTWRQKLHYGLIPLFYLSGIIFLINFSIPVISLFFGVFPFKIDFSTFSIICLPFITSVVLIRHYVQRWVMEDSERGFHVVGGLLLIGTWWVFNLGLIYTIIRKNVPYLPTPKDVGKENNFKINLPNIAVLTISLTAIVYSLYNDWNPFTLFMAGVAGLNCLFMIFTLLASVQFKFRAYKNHHPVIANLVLKISSFKRLFWLFRRRLYSGIRSGALMLTVLIACSSIYMFNYKPSGEDKYPMIKKKSMFLSGIFAPQEPNGLSSIKLVKVYQDANKTHADIISFYIPWGDQPKCFLPSRQIDSVYKNGSIPMITWEPWETLFESPDSAGHIYNEKKVFANVTGGKFDAYIKQFALQIKDLKKPVFLRFAHEADNPFYPWSSTGDNTAVEFKAAWKYVHQLFINNNVYNVVWVWNPWKQTAVKEYFPGKDFVDWIGITGLNFGEYNEDKKSYSFEQLYSPYHKLIENSGLPVMVAEMGSVKLAGHQDEWLKNGMRSIKSKFPEIKGYVLFNSDIDKNLPDGSTGTIDWKVPLLGKLSPSIKSKMKSEISNRIFSPASNSNSPVYKIDSNAMFLSAHGVNYTKGQYWYRNSVALTKETVVNDLTEMKKAGVNTVKLYGANIYDRTIFDVANRLGLKIFYGFWIQEPVNFINDPAFLDNLKKSILKSVDQNKDNKSIIAWNIGNYPLQKLADYYYKPELFYHQQDYLLWLRQLVKDIKAADPQRMVTVDVLVSPMLEETVGILHTHVPEIDSYGLILPENASGKDQIKNLKVPYFFSNANVQAYLRLKENNNGVFVDNWQDMQAATTVTFNGLKDVWGRNKPALYQLSKHWHGNVANNSLPAIKILRPALTTNEESSLPYHALVYLNNNWHMAGFLNTGLNFEWYLVKTNADGNAISMEKLGTGPDINVTIPKNAALYRLYLIGSKGENITTTLSILNIPL